MSCRCRYETLMFVIIEQCFVYKTTIQRNHGENKIVEYGEMKINLFQLFNKLQKCYFYFFTFM